MSENRSGYSLRNVHTHTCTTPRRIIRSGSVRILEQVGPAAFPFGFLVLLTLNGWSFPVAAHVSVPAASLLLLQLFGTPFLWPFVVVAVLTVFGANSKLSSITLLSGLLNAPPHPAPQIRRICRRHCAIYKFTYLLT